jgi:hypothetical protein
VQAIAKCVNRANIGKGAANDDPSDVPKVRLDRGFDRPEKALVGFGGPKKALVGQRRLWWAKEGVGRPKEALVCQRRLWYALFNFYYYTV